MSLLALPPELLEKIYHLLGSIDDVHHFAQTCRAAYHVIRRPTVYTEMMRSIIGRSPHHRFDLSLCRMLDLHGDVVDNSRDDIRPIPPTQMSAYSYVGITYHSFESQLVSAVTDECPRGICEKCLPTSRVHEILARYQGLRVLEMLWLTRQLKDADLLSLDHSADHNELVIQYDAVIEGDQVFQDGAGLARSSEDAEGYTSFNADQWGRFYSAITSVWLLNEIRWVLTNFSYPAPSFALQVRLLETCKNWITKRVSVPLLDELDRYAVFRFLYHHLLPLYSTVLAGRCSSKLPLTFSSKLEKSSVLYVKFFQLFLTAGQAYLQPPDLIDLVVRSKASRKAPYPLLPIPQSTDTFQRPSKAHAFPTDTDYTIFHPPRPDSYYHQFLRTAVTHLNLIGRATINQTEASPQTQWVQQADPSTLFTLQDDSAQWFKERALVQFELHSGNVQASRVGNENMVYEDARKVFDEQWSETWWKVFWWANSEDKARAKMERWRYGNAE